MRGLLFILFFIPGSALINAQSPGFAILNTEPAPTNLSQGGTSTAMPVGSPNIYTNPALLSLAGSSTIDISYADWAFDANYLFGGINFIKGKRAAAFGVYSSVENGFPQRDGPGDPNGTFSVTHLSVSAALAYNLGFVSAGISGQYLYQEIFTNRANGYAFNFGFSRDFFDGRIKTGASLLNIGDMNELELEPTQLPETFRAGLSLDVIEFVHSKAKKLPILVTLSGDFVMPLQSESELEEFFYEDENFVATGLMLTVADVIELNGGFRTGDTERPLSFGIGIITDYLKFNYALIPFNTGFGTAHSIGIQYKF